MSRDRTRRRFRRRLGSALVLTAAISVLGALWVIRALGVPVINPVYQVETISNGYRASLPLNLGQPGVPVVPRPVDVNRDGIFDIDVAVNLVDAKALLGLPPDAGAVLAPNIEIARDPAAVALCKTDIKLLSKCTPPLKVMVKLSISDSSNLGQSQVIEFGYDTGNDGAPPRCATTPCKDNLGRIGSIPPYFQATLFGLETFFNPLTAQVTTHGYDIVGTPLVDTDAKNGYEGPLDLVANIGDASGLLTPGGGLLDQLGNIINPQPTPTSELRFGYRPWPGTISVTYSSDDAGEHITYDHSRLDGVDLNAHVGVFDREGDTLSSSVLEGRIDRLPRHITVDLQTDDRSGRVRYHARTDGRLPDISISDLSEKLQVVPAGSSHTPDQQAKLDARRAGSLLPGRLPLFVGLDRNNTQSDLIPLEAPLLADVDVEAFPDSVEGRWSFPTDGPVSALFCGGDVDPNTTDCTPTGVGVGAADAHVQDFYAAPTVLTPFVPTEEQFLSYQAAPGGVFGRESVIAGRVEQIRELRFDQNDQGFTGRSRIGDGELPLQLNFSDDSRSGGQGSLVNATATVVPLPDDISLSFKEPGQDQRTDPLEVQYRSSESVDVNAHVDIRDADGGSVCGQAGTICGDLRARHIPTSIDVRVRDFPSDIPDDGTDQQFADSRIEIDSTPRAGSDELPDFFADVTLGQDDATPTDFTDDVPLVAHGELLGLPRFVRIRAREGANETLDRVEFHACDWNYDADVPACAPDTAGQIASLSFRLRNWTTRPSDLPILIPTTPMYATLAARGHPGTSDVTFEAAAKALDIAELQYRNTGKVFGVRSRIGQNRDFSAKVDIGNVDLPDDDPASGRIDAVGDVLISPLPGQIDFCLRSANQPIQTLSDDFTDACETDNPFGDPSPLTESPTTVSYHANTQFDVTTHLLLRQRGLSADIADDHTIRGTVNVTNLPSAVTVNLQSPKEGQDGQIRGVLDAQPGSPVTATIDLEATDGDLVCEDPRTPAVGKKAMCLSGVVSNLPSHATFRYDPTQHSNNLDITSDTQIDITGLRLSTVEGVQVPHCDDPENCYYLTVPKVLIAHGDITALPNHLSGTLDLPKTNDEAPTVDLNADPAIGHITATVQNFVAPDPFVDPIPDRTTGFGTPTQTVSFRQLGDQFKAQADLRDLKGVGYRTVKDADGHPLETKVVRVDFGHDQIVRAYADIEETPANQTIADVTINNAPAGIQVCFRGKDNPAPPGPGEATYCDPSAPGAPPDPVQPTVRAGDGAFQVTGTPDAPNATGMDADAFFRVASGGGSRILAGRVHAEGIPYVVEGTFPTKADVGDLDVAGLKKVQIGPTTNLLPAGITRIDANVADFDLDDADTGYATPPYQHQLNDTYPFPVTSSPNQHLKVAVKDDDYQARAQIGPGSQLQRLQMLRRPCPAPANNPASYPYYPPGTSDTTYTCLAGTFDPSAPNDPMDLQAYVQDGTSVVSLANAGLTDIPSHFQITLAKTPTLNGDANHTLRARCGPAASTQGTPDCMPPLIRFDQPDDSVLFGMLQVGTPVDLSFLPSYKPLDTLANLDALPDATGYADWGPGSTGIRAKVIGYQDRTFLQAGFRLAVPRSLTVDQFQSWSDTNTSQGDNWLANDTRLHYVVRDKDDNPVGNLGQLALLKQSQDLTQILVSKPCTSVPFEKRADNNPGNCDDFNSGATIPGELGIDLYERENPLNGKDYYQIDGRVSQKVDLGVRLIGTPSSGIGRLEGEVLNVPATFTGIGAEDPSFRLRLETLKTDKPKDCNLALCVTTDVGIHSVFASFNFLDARRVDAVVNQIGGAQGAEIKSFDQVRGGNPSPISARAFVDLNPLNVYLDSGLPWLAGARFYVDSQLEAGLSLDRSNHFVLRNNATHLVVTHDGPSGSSATVGPIDHFVYNLQGSAELALVPLLQAFFFPTSAPPADEAARGSSAGPVTQTFPNCGNNHSGTIDQATNSFSIGPGETADRAATLSGDGRLRIGGVLAPAGPGLLPIVGPALTCMFDVKEDTIPLMDAKKPGDTVGVVRTGHPIPDALDDSDPIPAPPADPTPNHADYTVSSNLALCGSFAFSNLTVASGKTLSVATTASNANTTGWGPDCPAGNEGSLEIFVDGKLTVNGVITASGIASAAQPAGAPTGNAGAGHGGQGGAGTPGTGGGTYGDVDPFSPATEPGGRGAGSGPANGGRTGNGGGTLSINAKDVVVSSSGQILANGDNGADGNAVCSATGSKTKGWGGGSGGGIVIAAFSVDNGGVIAARGGFGGSGGAGGGGGGGGGVVKILSPVRTGAAPDLSGRTGGTGVCGSQAGGKGADGTFVADDHPLSVPTGPPRFWNRDAAGSGLKIHVEASEQEFGNNGWDVFLCGYPLSPTEVAQRLQSGLPIESIFPTISLTPTSQSPCGITTYGPWAKLHVTSDRVSADIPTNGALRTSGYWGLWAVAVDGVPGDDCEHNPFPCWVEFIPDHADIVIGIDNTPPTLAVNPTDISTRSRQVRFSLDAKDQQDLSRLDHVECSNDGTAFVPCNNGPNDWTISSAGADGVRTIFIRALDFAGNITPQSVRVLLDTTVPTSSASVSGGTVSNGWYRVRPSITLNGSDPGGGIATGLATPAFKFRFDEGKETDCSPAPCLIDQTLITGLVNGGHTLHYTAVDVAGNRLVDDEDTATPSPMNIVTVKIDTAPPLSAFSTVPTVPDGANGWFRERPWATFSAVDQPGASGLTGFGAGIYYSVNGASGPFVAYDGTPFLLSAGSHNICWYAIDVATNQEPTQCTSQPIRVDDTPPNVTIAAPAPDGSNGWWKTPITATVSATDSTLGSGIPAGRLSISVDGGPFVAQPSTTTPVSVGEGLHTLQAFAVDASGQQSQVAEAAFMIDRSQPVSTARIIPPSPALDPWWRRLPRVVLRSTDGERNAGVQKIVYFIDGVGPNLYAGPFQVPAGLHTVTYQATDLSGRVETLRSLSFKTDVGPAVVRALSSQPLAFAPIKGDKTKLKWTVNDDLSHSIRATIIIYNNLGLVVRRITEATARTVAPNVTTTFATVWDGKDDGLAGVVPVGTYYYRVVVTDEAGNISMSGESAPLTVKIG